MAKRERLTITLRRDLLKQVDNMIDGKGARNRSHAIERILVEKFGDALVRRAVILGGGKGVSVEGYDHPTSPLLVEHEGKKLIEWHIDKLKSIGIEEVILAVGTFGDDVRAFVDDGARYDIKVIYFERDYGTASALRQAQSILKDTFIMFNGHTIVEEIDIEDMLVAHKNTKSLATIGLTTVPNPADYGQIILRGTKVVGYAEKPGPEGTVSYIVNAGIYIMEPGVCELVRPDAESLEHDIFPQLLAKESLRGYLIDVPWRCVKGKE